MNVLEVVKADVKYITEGYESDKIFGPIVKFLKGEEISDPFQLKKLSRIATIIILMENV